MSDVAKLKRELAKLKLLERRFKDLHAEFQECLGRFHEKYEEIDLFMKSRSACQNERLRSEDERLRR